MSARSDGKPLWWVRPIVDGFGYTDDGTGSHTLSARLVGWLAELARAP